MGKKYSEDILTTGNEDSFLRAIYKYIVTDEKLGSGITCSVTKWDTTNASYITIDDAEETDIEYVLPSDAVTYITTTYHLDDGIDLIFQSYPTADRVWEYNNYRVASNGLNIKLSVSDINVVDKTMGTNTWGSTCVEFTYPETQGASWKNVKPAQNRERKYKFSRYIDDNVVIFWINPYSSSSYKDADGLSIIKFKVRETDPDTHEVVENWYWGGYVGTSPIENSNVYKYDGSNPAIKSSMFPFEARTGYLDFISHSSFVSGSIKLFASTDIYDCTTVNFGDTLSLKDGANFLAIGAHSMVRLDDEEG